MIYAAAIVAARRARQSEVAVRSLSAPPLWRMILDEVLLTVQRQWAQLPRLSRSSAIARLRAAGSTGNWPASPDGDVEPLERCSADR